MSRRLGWVPAIVLILLLAACATRTRELGRAEVPDLTLVIDEEGPWREVPIDAPPEPPRIARAAPAPAPKTRPAAVPRRAAARTAPPRARLQPLPRRTPARPDEPARSPEEEARTRYLDHPTRLRAGRITFYCPARLLREVRLDADDVQESRAGRRVATGRARLLCRELTLEAEQIVVRTRPPGQDDLQITARGEATFVTSQGQQVIREDDAKSILITNDQVVPLR